MNEKCDIVNWKVVFLF